MLLIRVLSVVGVLAMATAVVYGYVAGDFSPWGQVMWARTVTWWLLSLTLVNLAAAAYAIAAFRSSDIRSLLVGSAR